MSDKLDEFSHQTKVKYVYRAADDLDQLERDKKLKGNTLKSGVLSPSAKSDVSSQLKKTLLRIANRNKGIKLATDKIVRKEDAEIDEANDPMYRLSLKHRDGTAPQKGELTTSHASSHDEMTKHVNTAHEWANKHGKDMHLSVQHKNGETHSYKIGKERSIQIKKLGEEMDEAKILDVASGEHNDASPFISAVFERRDNLVAQIKSELATRLFNYNKKED